MSDRTSTPSRRDVLRSAGTAAALLAGTAAIARWRWDRGGLGVHYAAGQRQVRDFRLKDPGPLDMVVVRGGSLGKSMSAYLVTRIEAHPLIDVRLHAPKRQAVETDRSELG